MIAKINKKIVFVRRPVIFLVRHTIMAYVLMYTGEINLHRARSESTLIKLTVILSGLNSTG